ncbi:MAG TPA: ATP-binding cassette domain-containing protein [Polyangiaceae bacterium]|jgi:phospholipid/cholesterol/gamma-HCH transport system ATP-binding protein|nr:ATP-binding cassette domain-containing protein [Polyangiaceae bacterium]
MSAASPGQTPSPRPTVVVRELAIGWGDVILIDDISFEVSRGEIFAILGGSGAGKSTLLRYLIGLEKPTKGAIDVAGRGPPDLDRGLPPFGVMFQEGALFGSMTVLENVSLPLCQWAGLDGDAVQTVARSKLRLVGLQNDAQKLPAEISGGMTKRAAIARALALDPPIAFLDEPSAGLDPVTAVELDNLILTLARTTALTVVMVTHELESVFRIADRCLLLDKVSRKILAIGDPRELRSSADPRIHGFFNPAAAGKERSWRRPQTT